MRENRRRARLEKRIGTARPVSDPLCDEYDFKNLNESISRCFILGLRRESLT